MNLNIGIRDSKGLCVSIYGDKLNAANTFFDHAVNGIRTAAAYTYNFDYCKVVIKGVSILNHLSSSWHASCPFGLERACAFTACLMRSQEPQVTTLNLKLRLTLHAKRGIFAYLEGFVNNYVEIMKTASRCGVFAHLTCIAYWEEFCCSVSVFLV